MKKTIESALNKQLNNELQASYNYLAFATIFENQNLRGFAKWMLAQSQEENTHAMKFYTYIFEANGSVSLEAIQKPSSAIKTPLKIFEKSLEMEQSVTKNIYQLVELSQKEKDYATLEFLQWFVKEQVEEESTIRGIIDQIKMIGEDGKSLFLLDKELGSD